QCAAMPLVEPLPADRDPEIAELARFFEGTLGFAPNSVLTMMRRPALARAFTALNRAVMSNDGRVGSELKWLIGHVASRVAGCRYCEAHTIRAAARFGAAEARDARRLEAVWSFRGSALFDDAERAALEFACAAASVPGTVTPAIAAELRRHWDDGEIVEITGVVALFGFLNRWNDAMATELEAPAAADGERWLATQGWTRGKHGGTA
nr:carboxymuconolactone decarboxylase family protein [Burkholderiaceae bacterium]